MAIDFLVHEAAGRLMTSAEALGHHDSIMIKRYERAKDISCPQILLGYY